jgi:hypothetical protein
MVWELLQPGKRYDKYRHLACKGEIDTSTIDWRCVQCKQTWRAEYRGRLTGAEMAERFQGGSKPAVEFDELVEIRVGKKAFMALRPFGTPGQGETIIPKRRK